MDDWFLWDSFVSSLHCPLPVPLHHYKVPMTYLFVFRGKTFFMSLFLSLSLIGSLKRERHQTLFESIWQPMSVRCSMSYKPIQRGKLHETSAGRRVTFWYGVGFPMLYLCCCWLLVATGWLWVAQGSEVSSLTSVWLMIQWECCSPGLLGTVVD